MTTPQTPASKFLLILTYAKPLEEVDAFLPAHKEFLSKGYEAGKILFSGRRTPRIGGVILVRGGSAEEVRAFEDGDPFVRNGVATYEIIEFTPSRAADNLDELMMS
ncbi:MAG: YciI family protein [Capsulimonadaceae bacterium]|nr:YciI family protein [Capsulimonadaceae bacterium]